MKKNKAMRAASGLLVATLLTTSMISGTMARYTTQDNASDTARVAKWGVGVTFTDNSLFSTTYATDDNTATSITNSVVASDDKKVVAPGTKEANTLTFTISGSPEVAVHVDASMDVINDVLLKGGTYSDCTTGGSLIDTFDQNGDYYPVVYTLTKNGAEVKKGNLAAIEEYVEAFTKDYKAGSAAGSLADINGTYVLSWAWDFGAEGTNDKADTLLGNLAAGTVTGVNNDKYNLNTDFSITITATQID